MSVQSTTATLVGWVCYDHNTLLLYELTLTEDLSDVLHKRTEAFLFGGDDAGDAQYQMSLLGGLRT